VVANVYGIFIIFICEISIENCYNIVNRTMLIKIAVINFKNSAMSIKIDAINFEGYCDLSKTLKILEPENYTIILIWKFHCECGREYLRYIYNIHMRLKIS